MLTYDKIGVMARVSFLAVSLLLFLTVVLQAQEKANASAKPQPPAKVDHALRERVNQFYQDFVRGQFKDAEALVAPESKNIFVGARKEQYVNCEIKGIDYSDNYKLADVGVVCGRHVMVEGFAGQVLQYPMGNQWKLEHGKWFWYVDPNAPRVTPFGMMGAMVAAMGGSPVQPQPQLPSAAQLTSPDIALHKVKADKQALTLKEGESAEVVIANTAMGPMSFTLDSTPPGFEVTPTHADLQANGKATVTVKALDGAKAAALNFRVMPTGEVIVVKVDIH